MVFFPNFSILSYIFFQIVSTNYDNNKGEVYSSLIFFSCPNNTHFTIDITGNITSSINTIIKLYEKCNNENNIF